MEFIFILLFGVFLEENVLSFSFFLSWFSVSSHGRREKAPRLVLAMQALTPTTPLLPMFT